MRIVQLTEAEAANSAVMENVSRYLLDGDVTHVQQAIGRGVRTELKEISDTLQSSLTLSIAEQAQQLAKNERNIGIDAPDVGVEQPVVPLASPFASIGFGSSTTETPPATIGFGGTAVPSPATAAAGSVPSLPPGVTQERRAVPPAPLVNAPVAESLVHAGVELDKNGLYWDERIHSSSREKNKDGTWRIKRGVEKDKGADYITKVEAEIRAVLAIPGPAGTTVPQPPTVGQMQQETLIASAVPAVPAAPSVPQPPVAAASVPTPPASEEPEPAGQAFMRWMEALTPDMQPGGRFTPELMTKLLAAQGLPSEAGLMAFVQRPDLVPAARAMLDTWLADPSQVPQ